MARIRTIKPDFWTDEKVVELSFEARLFFIGSWNFADDNGNLQRSAKKLKMQIFPADVIDCEPLIRSLMTHGMLIEYEVNGDKFLHIKGFKAHQVINRPSKSALPTPEMGTIAGVLTEDSLTEGKGREGKGREKEGKGEEQVYAELRQPLDETPAPLPSSIVPNSRGAAISVLMRRAGVEGCNAANPIVQEWAANAAVTDDVLLTAADMAKKREVMRPGPAYLAPIVQQLLNPKPPKASEDAWRRSDKGIERKASELGVYARPGETHDALRERCESELRRRAQGVAA